MIPVAKKSLLYVKLIGLFQVLSIKNLRIALWNFKLADYILNFYHNTKGALITKQLWTVQKQKDRASFVFQTDMPLPQKRLCHISASYAHSWEESQGTMYLSDTFSVLLKRRRWVSAQYCDQKQSLSPTV